MAIVYKIVNNVTNKVVVGVTSKTVEDAFKYWMKNCRRSNFEHYDIAKDYKKYGQDSFEIKTLMYVDTTGEAYEVADNFIDKLVSLEPNGYNKSYIGIRKRKPDYYEKNPPTTSIDGNLKMTDKIQLEKEMIGNYGIDGIVNPKFKKNFGTKETIEGLRDLADDLEKYGNTDVLSIMPKKLNDELEKYGSNVTKILTRRQETNPDIKYVLFPNDMIPCLKCGNYKIADANFYTHLEDGITYDNYVHICKECLEKYSEDIFEICKNPLYVIISLCQLTNMIFIKEVADKAVKMWMESGAHQKYISKYYFSDLKSVWAKRKDVPKSLLEFRHSNFVGDIFSFEEHNPLTPKVFIKELNEGFVKEDLKDKDSLETMEQKWGKGFKKDEYEQMEEEFSKLEKFLPKKTDLHMDALKKYVIYSSKERKALADGRDLKEVKEWNALADKAAENAQLKIKQLSTDFGEGVNSFAQLAETVEEYYSVIPTLPKARKMPYDDIDFLIWQNVNYIRRLEGKPETSYEEIYYFIDEELTKKMKDSGMSEEQIAKAKEERNAIFEDLSDTYQEPLWLIPTMEDDEEDDDE